MTVRFSADEVFEMAMELERNGARFYRTAAAGAEDKRRKDLLLGLADMEDNHEKTFAKMRAELAAAPEQPVFEADVETNADLYLQAIADRAVFDAPARPMNALTGKEPFDEVLKVAIGMEKESILFYTGMKEMVPGPEGRRKIDAIIREELSHVALLTNARMNQ